MRINVGVVEIDVYQLLVHDKCDCGRVDPEIICEEVNGLLAAVFGSEHPGLRLVSPEESGLRRFIFRTDDILSIPNNRVYSVAEAKDAMFPWLRKIVDSLNKLEI